ncbi:unnamed protein product [Cladocopium goreaui]|uniref:Uncharacterized protein n=1 Tax=Cladocopium goreaui TaxID=2562237 RepID=A0A9P1D9R6_9DINO|nr:unnamed protein product [Cladocopium goreaui]
MAEIFDGLKPAASAAVPTGIVLISTKLAELLGVSNGEQVQIARSERVSRRGSKEDGAEPVAGVRRESNYTGSLPPEKRSHAVWSESPLFPHARNDHSGRRTVHGVHHSVHSVQGRILGTPQAKVAEELPEHLHTTPRGYVPRPMASVASAHGFHHPPMPVAQPTATPTPQTPPVGPVPGPKVGPGYSNPGQPGYHPVYAQPWRVVMPSVWKRQEEEAMELAQLRTQLLQVKMELGSSESMNESEGLYGKLEWQEDVKSFQVQVPPCWFGKPEKSQEPLGPDGKPAWCQHVSYGARPYVEECSDLGATPKAAPAPTKNTKKPAMLGDGLGQGQDCSDQIESLWLRQREANLAWRPALLEMESAENSSSMVYGKLLTTAPHWCGYIPWLVQFVVPPCWFGKPAPSTGPLGPDGKPEWCKWVSPSAIEYVPDCKGGMYDKGPLLGAAPPPATRPNVKPGWCSHVPKDGGKNNRDFGVCFGVAYVQKGLLWYLMFQNHESGTTVILFVHEYGT